MVIVSMYIFIFVEIITEYKVFKLIEMAWKPELFIYLNLQYTVLNLFDSNNLNSCMLGYIYMYI